MNKLVIQISRIVSLAIIIFFILYGLLAIVALQGTSGDGDFLFFGLIVALNLIALVIMFVGVIKNYKPEWINDVPIIHIAIFAIIAFLISLGGIKGDIIVPLVVMIPSVVYLIGLELKKRSN